MQLDWNDLNLLATLRQTGTFGAAARLLGVDPTTVSRRIRAAEAARGVTLVERDVSGRVHLTEEGARLADIGARISAELDGKAAEVRLRVSAAPFLVSRVLAPALKTLLGSESSVKVDLLSDSGNVNLTRRTADIALRLARPDKGGHHVLARRIARIAYAPVATAAGQGRPWIGYDPAMAHLSHAAWIEKQGKIGARVTDLDAALKAAEAGAGPTLMPASWVAPPFQALAEAPVVSRDIWLLTFRDIAHRPAVRQVSDWAEAAVKEAFRAP